jgi:polysaccharide lyase-like protein
MTVHSTLRLVARPALVAVASLLAAAGCSAPPGAGDDTVPEFGFVPPGVPGVGATGVVNGNGAAPPVAASSGAGGSTGASSSEQIGSSGGIGLNPAPAGNQNGQNQGAGGSTQSQGAGGSMMAGAAPGASNGTGGSSGAPGAMGSAGAATMPPSGGDPQQPPAQQPPTQPPAAQQPQEPAPSGDCAGAFFCDGFESVASGASPTAAVWSIIESFSETDQSDLVQVSSDNAHGGAQALRITGSGGRTGVVASIPQSSYFVRAFFQLDAVPVGPVFIGAGNDQGNENRFRIQGQSFATINVNTNSGESVRPANANGGGCPDCVTLTANQWFCAEMFIDDAAKTATLWIDGVEAAVAGPDVFTTQPASPNLFLGSWGLQGGTTGAWIDDVAVGPERFGCN